MRGDNEMGKNTINTNTEMYDAPINDEAAPMTQEEILTNEGDILQGLLSLGRERDDEANYTTIQIKRNGAVKLEFRIRPITEEENQQCVRMATKYAPTKPGQPKVAIETDGTKARSHIVYTATVDEDRAKVWDNQAAKNAFNILDSVDMVDMVLKAGEKDGVIKVIDEISGFNDETEELVGNSLKRGAGQG